MKTNFNADTIVVSGNNLVILTKKKRIFLKIPNFIDGKLEAFINHEKFYQISDLPKLKNSISYKRMDYEDSANKLVFIPNSIAGIVFFSHFPKESVKPNLQIKLGRKVYNGTYDNIYHLLLDEVSKWPKSMDELLNLLINTDVQIYLNSKLELNSNSEDISYLQKYNLDRISFDELMDDRCTSCTAIIEVGFPYPIVKLKCRKTPIGYISTAWYKPTQNTLYNACGNLSAGFDKKNSKLSRIKAWAEGMERYHSGYISGSDSYIPSKNIDNRIVEKITGCSIQFSAEEILVSEVKKIYKVEDFFSQKSSRILIPAKTIYYPYYEAGNNFYANSNGIAAGRNYTEAIERAILEMSERDSIVLAWLGKITLPKIEISSIPIHIQKTVFQIQEHRTGTLTILDARLDKKIPHFIGIYTIMADGEPYFYVGASAHFSKEIALEKTIHEIAVSVYGGEVPKPQNIGEDQIVTVTDHRHFYCNERNFKKIEFLFGGANTSYEEIVDYHCPIEELIISKDPIIYIKNLTTQYSLEHNLKIVRVFTEFFANIWFCNKNSIPLLNPRVINILKQRFHCDELTQEHIDSVKNEDWIHFFD